jgi:hypothetical protein
VITLVFVSELCIRLKRFQVVLAMRDMRMGHMKVMGMWQMMAMTAMTLGRL